jgi:hypothetical protein
MTTLKRPLAPRREQAASGHPSRGPLDHGGGTLWAAAHPDDGHDHCPVLAVRSLRRSNPDGMSGIQDTGDIQPAMCPVVNQRR